MLQFCMCLMQVTEVPYVGGFFFIVAEVFGTDNSCACVSAGVCLRACFCFSVCVSMLAIAILCVSVFVYLQVRRRGHFFIVAEVFRNDDFCACLSAYVCLQACFCFSVCA